jgi:general secretion pathway protein J
MMQARYSRGFTLIELMIAFALLGLITLLLYAAFDFAAQSWDRVETKAQDAADLRLVQNFLRREISRTFPLRIGTTTDNRIAFEGDAHQLRFVTALPGNVAGGGLSMVSLDLVEERAAQGVAGRYPSAKSLQLSHAVPAGDARDFGALDQADKNVLLTGIEQIEFAYYGQENDQAALAWSDAWKATGRLPALLRIRMKAASAAEPREMIIALRLGEEAGCYQSSFQRLCGPRR